jgi:hypothetical protein
MTINCKCFNEDNNANDPVMMINCKCFNVQEMKMIHLINSYVRVHFLNCYSLCKPSVSISYILMMQL